MNAQTRVHDERKMGDRPSKLWWILPTLPAAGLLVVRLSIDPLASRYASIREWLEAGLADCIDPAIAFPTFILLALSLYYRLVACAWIEQHGSESSRRADVAFFGIREIRVRLGLLVRLSVDLLLFAIGVGVASAMFRAWLGADPLPPWPGLLLKPLFVGLGGICVLGFTVSLRPRRTPVDPNSAFHLTKSAVYFLGYLILVWFVVAYAAARVRLADTTILKPIENVEGTAADIVWWYFVITAISVPLLTVMTRALSGDIRLGKTSRVLPLLIPTLWYAGGYSILVWLVCERFLQADPSLGDLRHLVRTAAVGWALSIVPLLFTVPGYVVGAEDRAAQRRLPQAAHGGRQWTARAISTVTAVQMQQIRGHLALITIVQHHLPVFLASLPVSLLLSMSLALGVRTGPNGLGLLAIPGWVAATLAWLGPVLNGLYFIEDTYHRSYERGLNKCLHRLRGHTVIYGFGDFTRRFIRDQLEKGVWSYEKLFQHLRWSENILMPTGRLGKVLTYVAAIDTDGDLKGIATTTAEELTVSAVDFTSEILESATREETDRDDPEGIDATDDRTRTHDPDVPADYVVPVVLGDALSEETQRLVRVVDASFVACLIPSSDGPERSQGLLRRLEKLARRDGHQIPAVLEVHSSRYAPYVSGRALSDELPVHYIHSDHLEGLNAANVLVAAFEKERIIAEEESGQPCELPRILICGRDRQTFYLIDAFLKRLSADDYFSLASGVALASDPPTFQPSLVMLGQYTTFADADFSKEQLQNLAAYEPTHPWALIHERWGLQPTFFKRFIERIPSTAAESSLDEPPVTIPVVPREASEHEVLDDVMTAYNPHIILLSGYDAHIELRILQALLIRIRRNDAFLPLLLVSGRTGKRHVARYFSDALLYYSALWHRRGTQSPRDRARFERYPSPAFRQPRRSGPGANKSRFSGDAFIDVLQDPVERLHGLLRCYCEPRPDQVPLQLDYCVPERFGVMGANLAALAGLEAKPVDELFQGEHVPSLLNSRFILARHRDENDPSPFAIRAFSRLVRHSETPSSDNLTRVAVTYGREFASRADHDVDRILDGLLAKAGAVASNCDRSASVFDEHWRRSAQTSEWQGACEAATKRLVDQIDDCCGMPTCPVEAMQKSVEAVRWTVGHDEVQARPLQAERLRLITNRFRVGHINNRVEPSARDAPTASIQVECAHGHLPGTFAAAVNALVFRQLDEPDRSTTHHVNLKYVSSYECHDKRYGVFTCYGVLEAGRAKVRASVIKRVTVRPVSGRNEWEAYLRRLAEFLNGDPQSTRDYKLDPDESGPWELVLNSTRRIRIQERVEVTKQPVRAPRPEGAGTV